MLVMDESLSDKCLKAHQMINHALPGPEPKLHISEQLV